MEINRKSSKNTSNWFMLYLLCATVGFVGIYMKLSLILSNRTSIGRSAEATGKTFLSLAAELISWDVILNLYVIPAAILLVAVPFVRWRKHITLLISCLLIIFYFIQIQAQNTTGQYASFQLLYDGFIFALTEPNVAGQYVNTSAFIKLIVILLFLFSITPASGWLYRAKVLPLQTRRLPSLIFLSLMIAIAAVALFFLPHKANSLSVASVVRLSRSLVEYSADGENIGMEQSIQNFQKFTQTDPASVPAEIQGSEKGSNLLFFVLETAPLAALGNDASFLVPPALRQHAFVAKAHFSTYPYTSDALYSVFSGLYPNMRQREIRERWLARNKSLVGELREAGYRTLTYVPKLTVKSDSDLFCQLGFSGNYVAFNHKATEKYTRAMTIAMAVIERMKRERPSFDTTRQPALEELLSNDLLALTKLREDIKSAASNQQKFAFAFLPQIGHGPWPWFGKEVSPKDAIHYFLLLQMQWLGEIIDTLNESGLLDNTIMVVLGDHGVRTKIEDPAFPAGTISPYSFRVPFVIYAPHAFGVPASTDSFTSHIDIVSTLATMLGVDDVAQGVEGMPIWQATPQRKLFFFARVYGGADGFYDKGRFFMQNDITGLQSSSATMDFSSGQATVADPEYMDNMFGTFDRLHNSIIMSRKQIALSARDRTASEPQRTRACMNSSENDASTH